MRVVSPFLKRVVYPSLSRAGVLQRLSSDRELSVVTYHGVAPAGYERLDSELDGSLVTVPAFRRQVRFFNANYNVIHPAQFLAWRDGHDTLPPNALLLTCDDGLLNVLTDMLPILQEEGLSCLFFATADSLDNPDRQMLWYEQLYLMMLLGPDLPAAGGLTGLFASRHGGNTSRRSLWWDLVLSWSRFPSDRRAEFLGSIRDRLGLPENWKQNFFSDPCRERRFGLLNRSELSRLADAGMEIGSHTLSHPVLSQMTAGAAAHELTESRRRLQAALQKPVRSLAYPFGDPKSVTAREIEIAQTAGYRCAFMSCEASPMDSPLAMGRLHMTSDITVAEIQAHLSGFYAAVRRLARVEHTHVMVEGT
jgi:peptidoglycan/xylan/chitin deacetylase (PgdA/CDA1 family)